jgi:hypothetical protein
LGIGFHVLSALEDDQVEAKVRRALAIPDPMKVAFAVRLGYPVSGAREQPRVRREIEDFAHRNRYGVRGL